MQTLSTLDRLNGLHTEIMTVAFLSKRTSQWWYNTLPTPEKRLMSSFQHQWREFNLTAIAHARKVPLTVLAIQQRAITHKMAIRTAFSALQNAYTPASRQAT